MKVLPKQPLSHIFRKRKEKFTGRTSVLSSPSYGLSPHSLEAFFPSAGEAGRVFVFVVLIIFASLFATLMCRYSRSFHRCRGTCSQQLCPFRGQPHYGLLDTLVYLCAHSFVHWQYIFAPDDIAADLAFDEIEEGGSDGSDGDQDLAIGLLGSPKTPRMKTKLSPLHPGSVKTLPQHFVS